MIVHLNTANRHFKIVLSIEQINPREVFFRVNMSSLVKASNLKVAAIFTKTHSKLSRVYQACFFHHVVDWSKLVETIRLLTQTKNAINLLRIEVLSLCMSTAKRVLKPHIKYKPHVLVLRLLITSLSKP